MNQQMIDRASKQATLKFLLGTQVRVTIDDKRQVEGELERTLDGMWRVRTDRGPVALILDRTTRIESIASGDGT